VRPRIDPIVASAVRRESRETMVTFIDFLLEHLAIDPRADNADAAGSGDEDRRLEDAALFDPMGAGHVAIAVAGEEAGEHCALIVFAAGKDRGNARADRAFPADQRTFT